MRLRKCGLPLWLLAVGSLLWCQSTEPVRFVGVGSTIGLRTYALWLSEFEKSRTNVHAAYLPFGSVHGAELVATGTADFAASEVPELPRSVSHSLAFFPVAVGAIVPTYNLPGVRNSVRFTPQALAGIYLGTITR